MCNTERSSEPANLKSRSGTLTRENVRNVLESVDTLDASSPNSLLFSLFLYDLRYAYYITYLIQ